MLCQLPRFTHPHLLVGIDTSDDAGVYQLNETTALIQTLDFFTPIVDDPYTFGQIAAANSLSDVYAMGGRPLTALNIVGFPICTLQPEVLGAILRGGQDKVMEAGAVIAGGHTIDDPEPKYGLSVTGVVHPQKIWRNIGAQPGDVLVLTKAVGTGIMAMAVRTETASHGLEAAIDSMRTLNATAAEVLSHFTVHACTDITGFGLLGHIYEMASGSGVRVIVDSHAVPLLPDAARLAALGLVPGGADRNREYLKLVTIAPDVPEATQELCFDPQTSGGLLVSIPENEAKDALQALKSAGVAAAAVIGQVKEKGEGEIYVW